MDAVKVKIENALMEVTIDRPKANAIDPGDQPSPWRNLRRLPRQPRTARRHHHRRRRPFLLRRLGT